MKDKPAERARQERLLDEALQETFPASDPVSTQQILTVGAATGPDVLRKRRPKKNRAIRPPGHDAG